MAHLSVMSSKAETDEEKKRIQYLIEKTKDNKWKYQKKSKDEIREEFYVNGVPIEYKLLFASKHSIFKVVYSNCSCIDNIVSLLLMSLFISLSMSVTTFDIFTYDSLSHFNYLSFQFGNNFWGGCILRSRNR